MSKVFIRAAEYEGPSIARSIGEMLGQLPSQQVFPGARIVVKPNLLLAAPPEQGIVTHPLVVRTVVEYLLDKGTRVQVSDSPPVGNFQKILRTTGYEEALKGLDVEVKPFEESVEVDIGEPFGRIPLARDAVEADGVINLAKLKTHAQMFLTLGVKNMFGCVVGLRKPEWHMRAGVDRQLFARLLVRIYEAVAPIYTIVDGVVGLEGQGPGKSGTPRSLGMLVGGGDAHAVDKVTCIMLGFPPEKLWTQSEAMALSAFNGHVHIGGDLHIVHDYKLPELHSLSMGPESFNRFVRKYMLQKPVVDQELCKLCGECWNICPAKVISHDARKVRIDYDRCIRCYCCLEVCPYGAIRAQEPLLGSLRRRLTASRAERSGE
jgi:uncharacterized protein (DUF362 family)/Pyruvate/2-oxoacid:ferredoxin oxidoreductase delta subunit